MFDEYKRLTDEYGTPLTENLQSLAWQLEAEVLALRADVSNLSNAVEVFDFDDLSDYGLQACGLKRIKRQP